jgi:hypothetical protein
MCRKSHGAAFATWLFVEPEHFRWTSGAELVAAYASSPGVERCFCTRCGSPLAARLHGHVVEVTCATLDGEVGVRPREHIFVGSKASWHEITDDLPQFDAFPPGWGPEPSS